MRSKRVWNIWLSFLGGIATVLSLTSIISDFHAYRLLVDWVVQQFIGIMSSAEPVRVPNWAGELAVNVVGGTISGLVVYFVLERVRRQRPETES